MQVGEVSIASSVVASATCSFMTHSADALLAPATPGRIAPSYLLKNHLLSRIRLFRLGARKTPNSGQLFPFQCATHRIEMFRCFYRFLPRVTIGTPDSYSNS